MKERLGFRNKLRFNQKKRDSYVLIFSAIFILSILVYITYLEKPLIIPPDFPTLYISCEDNLDGEDFSECKVKFDEEIINSFIKYRGGSALEHDKKGYRIELKKQKTFLGMRRDDDWQLFANYLDFTRMRVKLSFDLWGTLESTNPTAILPEAENICLYLNGDFQGLYLLAERPDRKLFDLDTSLNGINSSLIFQSKGETKFNEYIKEKWEQDWPNVENINIMDEVLSELISFVNSANDNEFFDLNSGIYNRFDKVNLIDYLVYNFFIAHKDCWLKNYFIVRNTYPSKFFLVPWDFDGSFGQWGWIKYDSNDNTESEIRNDNVLWNRLLGNSEFMQECKSRWNELRETLWTEEFILDMLFDDYEEIKELIEIDTQIWKPITVDEKPKQKWPYMYKYSTKEFDLEEYLEYLFNWIPERLQYCDYYFNQF